jgi:hypothetical protein
MEQRPAPPELGDRVRYGESGPVVLTVERVGVYEHPRNVWNVVAGGISMVVRLDGGDGIPWRRVID